MKNDALFSSTKRFAKGCGFMFSAKIMSKNIGNKYN